MELDSFEAQDDSEMQGWPDEGAALSTSEDILLNPDGSTCVGGSSEDAEGNGLDSNEGVYGRTEEDNLGRSEETEDSTDYAPYPWRQSKQVPEEHLSQEVGEEMRKRHWSEISDDARQGAISWLDGDPGWSAGKRPKSNEGSSQPVLNQFGQTLLDEQQTNDFVNWAATKVGDIDLNKDVPTEEPEGHAKQDTWVSQTEAQDCDKPRASWADRLDENLKTEPKSKSGFSGSQHFTSPAMPAPHEQMPGRFKPNEEPTPEKVKPTPVPPSGRPPAHCLPGGGRVDAAVGVGEVPSQGGEPENLWLNQASAQDQQYVQDLQNSENAEDTQGKGKRDRGWELIQADIQRLREYDAKEGKSPKGWGKDGATYTGKRQPPYSESQHVAKPRLPTPPMTVLEEDKWAYNCACGLA